jgi:hypothetical protein
MREPARPSGSKLAAAMGMLEGVAARELMAVAVQLFPLKERARGFNQAALLAEFDCGGEGGAAGVEAAAGAGCFAAGAGSGGPVQPDSAAAAKVWAPTATRGQPEILAMWGGTG